jgi:hypothetical protein
MSSIVEQESFGRLVCSSKSTPLFVLVHEQETPVELMKTDSCSKTGLILSNASRSAH